MQCVCFYIIPCNDIYPILDKKDVTIWIEILYRAELPPAEWTCSHLATRCMYVCIYVCIYSPDMDIQKYTVKMKIIVNSVKISSPIGTISNSEVVDLQ